MTKQTILSDDACWAALVARDKTADTLFVYAVKTTQTWGFPSTVVRLPKRENTEFFATPEDAEAHGYRAGKRRQRSGEAMTQRHAEQVVLACRELETRIARIDTAVGRGGAAAITGSAGCTVRRESVSFSPYFPVTYRADTSGMGKSLSRG